MTTLTDERLRELRADVQDELIVEVDNEWNNERRRMRHDHAAAIDELLALRGREGGGKGLTYDEIEKHMYRMYDFGKTDNPVSAQCECQAVRIKLGYTGAGAVYPPAPQVAESEWVSLQYQKIQDFVIEHRLFVGLPRDKSHADVVIELAARALSQPDAESQGAQLSSAPWKVVSGKENAGKGWPVCTLGVDHNDVFWYIETDGVHASEAVSEPENDARAIVAWRNALAGSVR